MISSVGRPDPIAMRKLLNFLARCRRERIERRAQARRAAARKNARPRRTIKA